MKDEVPTAHLIINKKGEFLEHISLLDGALGSIEHFFEYVSGELKEVTFEVYAAEDIKAADGVSEDDYKKDELVITITTDDNGIAQAEGLPVGKYYVKEAETAYGYILDDEIRYVDLSYRDQDTSVVVYSEDWQNNRQKVQVQVVKKEAGTDRVLEGAVFGLFAKEDILSTSGEVLLMADTLIEQKATDGAGTLQFLADLPIDGNYYVKELEAPDGFVTNEEIQEFTFAYEGNDVLSVTYEFTFENEPTTVELTKADLTTGDELPGAHLEVTDKDGNIIDEWISTEEPHIIKELTVGETYTMTETKPADGYVTAESIVFTVEDTAEIQKHEMLDDVTKVQISKVDMTDGSSEVKGAKLYILNEEKEVIEHWVSGEEPHYIEKLPVGTYTLLEETAPKGYIISNSVEFEVLDTGEVQSVMMKDDHAVGKLILNKTDKEPGEPMKGVEFTLYDNKGNVLETLLTDSAGHAESNEYPIATFTEGKYGETLTYILKETKTLKGYVLDETEHEITFVYVDDKTPVIEVTLELTNEEVKKEAEEDVPEDYEFHTTEAPKTGDETNIALFVVLFLVSLLGLAGVVVKRRKMNH